MFVCFCLTYKLQRYYKNRYNGKIICEIPYQVRDDVFLSIRLRGLDTESCWQICILKYWHNFLNLQIVMKNVTIKIFAVLLTVWYSMSIIGFDVHTCSGSGESFVVTFIKGLTCEDIHPEHSCKAGACHADASENGCCCHHEDESDFSFRSKSCCSNDYQVLELAGTLNSAGHGHYDECSCGLCPCVVLQVCETPDIFHESKLIAYFTRSGSVFAKVCERQAALSVWRI